VAIAVAAAALALPGVARAADALPTDEAAYQAEKEMWQARFREAREAVAAQRTRHRAAVEAYKEMRHRRHERGEEKQKILEELTDSEQALEESEKALQELLESARRAGVPPGWTRIPRGARGDSPAAPESATDDESALP